MKAFEQRFRKFLTEAELGQYVDGGQVNLFHYTNNPENSLLLDPNYKKSSYSKREFETAQTPRVFFYTDPKQRETFFRAGIPLFTTQVDANRIYDFRNDPEGYIEKNRHPVYGLRKGEEWNTLLEDIREDYDGIFYSTNRFDVVAWFQPIEVNKVPREEQAIRGRLRKAIKMKIKGDPYGIYVGTFVMNYHHGLLRLGVVREKRIGDHRWAYCKVDWFEDDIAIAAEAWDKKMGSTKEYSDETRADYLKPVSIEWLQNVMTAYGEYEDERRTEFS